MNQRDNRRESEGGDISEGKGGCEGGIPNEQAMYTSAEKTEQMIKAKQNKSSKKASRGMIDRGYQFHHPTPWYIFHNH